MHESRPRLVSVSLSFYGLDAPNLPAQASHNKDNAGDVLA
jgi:hypothetical protein